MLTTHPSLALDSWAGVMGEVSAFCLCVSLKVCSDTLSLPSIECQWRDMQLTLVHLSLHTAN